MTSAEKDVYCRILLLFGKKLVAVWSHLKTYKEIEIKLVEQARNKPPTQGDVVTIEHSQDLFLEFDEFLVQIKSSLDYLAKIPTPILTKKIWNLHTFGSYGEDVLKVLENNLPADLKQRANGFREVVFQKHANWLKETIRARDKINHFLDGGLRFEDFTVFLAANDQAKKIHVPMWSTDQTVSTFMEITWGNLIVLSEDFIAFFVSLKLKKDLTLLRVGVERGSHRTPWRLCSKKEAEAFARKVEAAS